MAKLNGQLGSDADKLEFTIGTGLELTAKGEPGKHIKSIVVNPSCSAYIDLIKGKTFSDASVPSAGETLNAKDKYDTTTTGGPNIVAVTGSKNGDWIEYTGGNNKVYPASSDQKYVDFTAVSPSDVFTGSNVEGDLTQGEASRMTLKGIFTQFVNNGKCIENLDFSLSVGGVSASVTIPKGTNIGDAVSMINNACLGKAMATRDGDDLKFEAAFPGAHTFNVSGTLVRSAKLTDAAKFPEAQIDIANNKVISPPALKLGSVGSHFPVEFTKDKDNTNLIIKSGDKVLYDPDLTGEKCGDAGELANLINKKITAAGGNKMITATSSDGELILTGSIDLTENISIAGTTNLDKLKKHHNGEECKASLTIKSISSHFPPGFTSGDEIGFDISEPNDKGGTDTTPIKLNLTHNIGSGGTLAYYLQQEVNKTPYKGSVYVNYVNDSIVITGPAKDNFKITGPTGNTDIGKRIEDNTKLHGAGYVPGNHNKVETPGQVKNSYFDSLTSGTGLRITEYNKHVYLNVSGEPTPVEFDLTEGTFTSVGSLLNNIRTSAQYYNVADKIDIDYVGGALIISTKNKGDGNTIAVGAGNTSTIFSRAINDSSPISNINNPQKCALQGNVNVPTIKIGSYNNHMTFELEYNGTPKTVKVTIPPCGSPEHPGTTYSPEEFRAAIQAAIDSDSNGVKGSLTVSLVGSTGSQKLRIEGATITNSCTIGNFEGPLFDMVFRKPSFWYVHGDLHDEKIGTTNGEHLAFIIGRNPMEPVTENEIENDKDLEIFDGVNDTLIFDFTYQGTKHEVKLDLDAGMYTREETAAHIEKKAREWLETNGITDADGDPIDTSRFRVTIGAGGLDLTSNGSHLAVDDIDKLMVMSFREYRDGSVEDSDALIEGIRGTAAYRVFYKATKSPEPTRIIGASDLSGGVHIFKDLNDELTFDLDGVPVTLKIREGFYTTDTICEQLNKQFEEIGSVVRTFNANGKIMYYTNRDGDYIIDKFRGSAANNLFYGGDLNNDHTAVGIHYGRRTGSYVWCDKACVNTRLLRLNTTGVTTMERSIKALKRIDGAINYMSSERASLGAYENRLERTRERNTVTSLNLS